MTIGKYLNERRIYVLIILILTAFAFFLRIYKLDSSSIWIDEAWRLCIARESESGHILSAIVGGTSGYIGVLKLLDSLTSGSVWDLRLFFAICGCVVVPLTYVLTTNVCSRLYAFLAGGLIAVSPILIIYSQEAAAYMLATALVLVQVIIFIRWIQSYSYLYGALFGAVSLILSNILPQSIFLTAGFLLYVVLSTKLQKSNEKKSFILCVLLFTPAILSFVWGITLVNMMANHIQGGFFSRFVFSSDIFDRIMTGLFNIPNLNSIYSPRIPWHKITSLCETPVRIVFGGLFAIAVIWALFQRKSVVRPISIALIIFLFGTAIGAMASNMYFERYFIAVQPLAVVVFIAFISGVIRRFPVIKIPLIMLLVLLMFSWGIITQKSAYGVEWKPPNKEAFEAIIEHARNVDEAYCTVPCAWEWPIADYYLKNNPKIVLLDRTFDFFGANTRPSPASLQLTEKDYIRLALQQIKKLKDSKKDNIFLYTQRSRFMIPTLREEMKQDYEDELIYDKKALIVIKFKLRTN
jgi:hypothetical protein